MAARASSSDTAADSNSSAASSSSSLPLDREQPDGRSGLVLAAAGAIEPESSRPAVGGLLALLEVFDPLAAPIGTVHARDEARHHGLELAEDHARVLARLGKRRRRQTQQELLVRLARREDPHVRERRRRQQAAQQVERLGADGARVGGLGLAVRTWETLRGPFFDAGEGVGISTEDCIHRCLVLGAELGVAPVAVAEAVAHRRVVGHVARGLLEVGGEPSALKQLRHHVRDPLAGDVSAA